MITRILLMQAVWAVPIALLGILCFAVMDVPLVGGRISEVDAVIALCLWFGLILTYWFVLFRLVRSRSKLGKIWRKVIKRMRI